MTTQIKARAEPGDRPEDPVEYPDSDGEPIGETDTHIFNILWLRQALRYVLRSQEDVYVAANMLFYYEKGNPAACRAPDVFAVKGVERHDRRCFKVWEEGRAPCLVIEVTSKKSQVEDLWIKRGLYEKLGIQEYVLFDPLGEYLDPAFQAFELRSGQYVPVTPGPGARFRSALGIELLPSGSTLEVIDPSSGEPVPQFDQAMDRAETEHQRAEAEYQRAEAERQRADRLEAELRRLQPGP